MRRPLGFTATPASSGRAIAARTSARGLPTAAEDLLIRTGSQQALTLVGAALLDPGDVMLVEEPSYLAAAGELSFALAGRRPATELVRFWC